MNLLFYPRAYISKIIKRLLITQQGFLGLEDHAKVSFSQMGEDIMLDTLFEGKENGFYVDVGAYHPKQYSNTYLLYLRGWHGINIDPNPTFLKQFNKQRPRDINVEAAIASNHREMTYYLFNAPAINTLSKTQANKQREKTQYKILEKKKMKTKTLKSLLDTYTSSGQTIDFFSIDVEGFDLEVLQSNDWSRYIPRVILVEDLDFCLEQYEKSPIYKFLHKRKYHFFAKTYNSLIFTHDHIC